MAALESRIIRFRDQSAFWEPRSYVPDLRFFSGVSAEESPSWPKRLSMQEVVTYNLHLESRGSDDLRVRQLNEVLADCRKYVDQPIFVVAGDFNLGRQRRRRLPRCPEPAGAANLNSARHVARTRNRLDLCYRYACLLRQLGLDWQGAACLASSGKGWWRMALSPQANRAMPSDWFPSQGLIDLVAKDDKLHI